MRKKRTRPDRIRIICSCAFYGNFSVQKHGLSDQVKIPRAWENELGDWWDATPLLPGMSLYFDSADLLLRLRGIKVSRPDDS